MQSNRHNRIYHLKLLPYIQIHRLENTAKKGKSKTRYANNRLITDTVAQDMMGWQSVPEVPQRKGGVLAIDLVSLEISKWLQGLSVKD